MTAVLPPCACSCYCRSTWLSAWRLCRRLSQQLLAAVAAGPGSGTGGPQDQMATVEWLDNCACCVKAWGRMISFMAAAGGGSGAELVQQLAALGVWRLLVQLVEATGACASWRDLCCASWLMMW